MGFASCCCDASVILNDDPIGELIMAGVVFVDLRGSMDDPIWEKEKSTDPVLGGLSRSRWGYLSSHSLASASCAVFWREGVFLARNGSNRWVGEVAS